MRPVFIPAYISNFYTPRHKPEEVKLAYSKIRSNNPEVSIVMPAYNEEATIVQVLASLCNNITNYGVEIIVVDNNSVDKTAELVHACGITCISEKQQGIYAARNAGLAVARGEYLLNADADTIYPQNWINEMVAPLINNRHIALTYGRFSFIPIAKTGRITYFFYEYFSDLTRLYTKLFKSEAINVYGFTSAMRTRAAQEVNGFHHPPGSSEDGYIAHKIVKQGLGRLYEVTSPGAVVWTTDRRIQIDGGLWRSLRKKLYRVFMTP